MEAFSLYLHELFFSFFSQFFFFSYRFNIKAISQSV